MVDVVFPKLSKLKSFLLRNHWNSQETIQFLKVPMLFVMGLKDELIPNSQMLELYQAAKSTVYKDKVHIKYIKPLM